MASTKSKAGNVAAPTLGAVIVSILNPADGAGFYRITVLSKFTAGTPAAIDADNFELLIDDVAVGVCSAGLALNTDYKTDFNANVTQSIKVRAKVAGTGGVTYDALVVYAKDA